MRSRVLSLAGRTRRVRDFWSLAGDNITEKAGVYILLATGRHSFEYPRGRSPIFYIGQAGNLRRRLKSHLKYAGEACARGKRRLALYWPRYEYAAVFGARYAVIPARPNQSPRTLECRMLRAFARKHRAFPVANSQGSWNKCVQS